MICVICRQAEPVAGSTLVTFERGEFRLLVRRVPARICPSCGEAYVVEEIAEELLRIAGQQLAAGVSDTQCEFGPL